MSFRPYDIITTKRDGKTHSREEIEYLIKGYTKGEIPDYQVSAWLMACFLNGLNEDETYYLSDAMLHSGKIIDLSTINKPRIDKHSTGGVGDKISLILAPAAAACDVAVPMTSGRGLGFSGGTLDKLESIPGYNVHLTEKQFIRILSKVGFAMTGQTDTLAPADKKLYELRDVTGTVENISLITASILSKKIAEGAESVVMDVKSGSGAFMKTIEQSRRLARSLSRTAAKLGIKVTCVISNMNQPLGKAVGNSLEVIESIECMTGKGLHDVVDLVSILGAYMLTNAGIAGSVGEGERKIREKLYNGEAFERFKDSVYQQGGDVESITRPQNLPHARHSQDVLAQRSGFIISINTELIGTAAVCIGAGRFKKDDSIDPSSGVIVHKKIGNDVRDGDALATLYFNDQEGLKRASELVTQSFDISDEKPSQFQLIHEVIG